MQTSGWIQGSEGSAQEKKSLIFICKYFSFELFLHYILLCTKYKL